MDMTWLDLWKLYSAALLAGRVIDWTVGDLPWLSHLMRLVETMTARMEQRFRRWTEGTGRKGQLRAGTVSAASMYMVWWYIPWVTARAAEFLWPAQAWAAPPLVEGFLCSFMLTAKGLYTEGMKMYRNLETGRTEEARYNVSMIMGRDILVLDEGGIARAAAETVAGNASDGVVAPSLFMAFLGLAGGTLYKAINTMDSMMGYKNGRYLYFGRLATRLGDLLNLALARLTGILVVPGAWVLPDMNRTHVCKAFPRDRKRYASPNSAHGETVCAGTLYLRPAGDAWYLGAFHKKSYIGDDHGKIEPPDIRRTNYPMFFVEGMMVFGLVMMIPLL